MLGELKSQGSLDYSKPQVSLFCASPRKGKSVAIKYTILHQTLSDQVPDEGKYKFGIVFTGSKFNNDYDYIPDEHVYEWDEHEEVLESYLAALQEMKENTGFIPPNFCVFDDVVGLMSKFDGQLNNFFSVHRHYNCHVFIAVQHLNTGSSTLLREVTTKAYMFAASGFNTIKSLFESFGQSFENLNQFKEFFLENTKHEYSALVYDSDAEAFFMFLAPDVSDLDVQISY